MGILDIFKKGGSTLGWGGGKVPSNPMSLAEPNPPGSRHETYSIDGNPRIRTTNAGFTAVIPPPSSLDEKDIMNVSTYKSSQGDRYLDKTLE